MIDDFRGEYRWLSNFYEAGIKFEGITYPSTEHAYQAAKTTDIGERRRIAALNRPKDAKREGAELKLRPGWEGMKLQVMETVLRAKFARPELAEMLLATGDEELIEGNTWGDDFWGVCTKKGQNHLGKLLMKIRKELHESRGTGTSETPGTNS